MRPSALLVLAACGSSPAKPVSSSAPAQQPMQNTTLHTCAEAAAGLERSTRGLRRPETSVLERMQGLCSEDTWPTPVIDCFAALRAEQSSDALGHCLRELAQPARDRVFAQLDGSALAIVDARLASLQVGIVECDRFVTAVRTMLGCEAMPLGSRVQLAAETADFWSLPTQNLKPDAQKRMAAVCGKSLADLQQRVAGTGCTP